MIRVENLVKTYGKVRALDGLGLKVEQGAVYGFLGPNGAGKTTTLRILAGLARPDSGRAWMLGQELWKPGVDLRARVGYLPEEPAFYRWLTPREYLRDLVAPLHGLRGREAAHRAEEMLEVVGLKEAAGRRMAGFSRGMRQRMGLAQAMFHFPSILLLDEPVSALDPAGRKDVLDLIATQRGRTTVLFSTHILADVDRICDVIGIIARGRLVVQNYRDDMLRRTFTPLFEVELEDDPAAWLDWVKRQAFVSRVSTMNQTLRLHVTDVRLARRPLLESLATHALAVRRFEVVQPSLEEVFLKLTSEEVQP
jgi:ABC-2 type transport system ATP-binding protein